jgi:hypothetical protein
MRIKPIPKIRETYYVLFDYHTGEILDEGSLENVIATMAYEMAMNNRSWEDFEVHEVEVIEVRTFKRNELETELKRLAIQHATRDL